jgi:hypothetical protein
MVRLCNWRRTEKFRQNGSMAGYCPFSQLTMLKIRTLSVGKSKEKWVNQRVSSNFKNKSK